MRNIIIIAAVLLIITGSYFTWQKYYTAEVCSKGCEEKTGEYNLKMSLVCEHSCAAKNINETQIVSQKIAKVGDYTRCPVSRVTFLVTNGSVRVKKDKKSAFTCCGTCANLFDESPDEYVKNIFPNDVLPKALSLFFTTAI